MAAYNAVEEICEAIRKQTPQTVEGLGVQALAAGIIFQDLRGSDEQLGTVDRSLLKNISAIIRRNCTNTRGS